MEEIWKDIKGYKRYYQISNLGNVRSLDRFITQEMPQHKCFSTRLLKGTNLKVTTRKSGYQIVELRKANKRKVYYVHRLVAEAFIDNPNNKSDVNHKDYNPQNNTVTNLEWTTKSENISYSAFRMTRNTICKNTNEKYISKNNNKYRLRIRIKPQNINYIHYFATLEEAIKARYKILKEANLLMYLGQ